MKAFEKLFICLAFLFFSIFSFAQQNKIDSLSALLKRDHPNCSLPCIGDTLKVNHLNALAWQLSFNNSDTALFLSTEALHLAQKILANNEDQALEPIIKLGQGVSYYQIGSFHDDKDDYILSMQFYSQALDLCRELLAKKKSSEIVTKRIKMLMANVLGNVGIVYRKQGDYPKALDFYFQALKLDEEIGGKKEISTDLGNIGVVYYKLKNYGKTLDYYLQALRIDEEIGNKSGVARHLGNLGGVYAEQNDNKRALDYYFKALKMSEELKNKAGTARHLGNIGNVYFNEKDNAKALDYYMQSLKIKEELGAKSLIVTGLRSIGVLYTTTKKYSEATDYLQKSLDLAEKLGSLDDIRECHLCLRDLYKETGNYLKALEHFQLAETIKDSLYSNEKDKEITRKEMSYEYEKKDAANKASQEKKDALALANSKKQQLVLIFVSVGLFLLFIFAVFIFRALKVARRQKKLIEEKNKQTEEQKKIIEQQKEIVEEKNKDIIDSINYAKRIQDALLKAEDHVTEYLPAHFILYKPKDIVSGDFYWSLEKENMFYIAAVDCTGHGVPGA
ncbi:MAG: tetratricopeptide repeat protein, partial [Bacteroidetes bacterium]|nr:tetratricopeptide repeat protein [Bacteroidota bacterium]